MTKEGERAAKALEKIVIDFLDVVPPAECDIVVEKTFAAVRAKRARRLTHPVVIKREDD